MQTRCVGGFSVTWSNLGEHGEHREHGKDGKYQPDDLKHSTQD